MYRPTGVNDMRSSPQFFRVRYNLSFNPFPVPGNGQDGLGRRPARTGRNGLGEVRKMLTGVPKGRPVVVLSK